MKHLIDCAMKREPCDLVVKNARVYNVFTGETEEAELAVAGGRIVGIGRGYAAARVYDGRGGILLPSFVDSHIHIESSFLSPEEFARLAVAHGTGTVVADPHELVNVCGVEGAEYVRTAVSRLQAEGVSPLDVKLQLPSCVPATPFETSGASLDGRETARELESPDYYGLGEMMNFPAVVAGEEDTLCKLRAAEALGKIADGHAPCASGDALNAYLCAGIRTDHESASAEECREKAARGMYVQIRCGSSTNDLEDAVKAVDGMNFRRFLLCSDDKTALELSERGHIDDALRRLVALGMDARYAVAAATLNAAECYGFKDCGALAPRFFADFVLVDDLVSFRVRAVFRRGVLVAEEGKAVFSCERYLPAAVRGTVRIAPVLADSFRIETAGLVRAMRIAPHGLVTEEVHVKVPAGVLDVKGTDLNKLAVVERHFATGNIGLGLVQGFGFHGGALGLSVAHDSHNLVILGDDDAAMARVAALLKEAGGGMALVDGGEHVFPLDIAGLMSSADAEEVVQRTGELERLARAHGVKEEYEPFMSLAFLSLAVIPALKLTDRGLFDYEAFSFVPLEVKQ